MRWGPFVIFGATFLVWITAKGEFGKYAAFATTRTNAPAAPADGPTGPVTGGASQYRGTIADPNMLSPVTPVF